MLGVAALVAAAQADGSSTIQQRIAAARAESSRLAADAQAKQGAMDAAAAQAMSAQRSERRLSALLDRGRSREAVLRGRAETARDRLKTARLRLARARKLLAERLVAIYKGGEPDATTIVLQADGFDDLATRAEYLRAIQSADTRLAERVRGTRDEVQRLLGRVTALTREAAEENRRLAMARDRIAGVRARADARAASLDRARAGHQRSLATLRSRISGWTSELQRLRSLSRTRARSEVGRWLGDFAIPKSIVMCESGGNYDAVNPTSGAGGAYQIMPDTWKLYGGKGRPQDAPKSQQDRIARKVWQNQGRGAWSC